MVARQERTIKHKLNIYLSQWRGWQQQALREGVRSVSALGIPEAGRRFR